MVIDQQGVKKISQYGQWDGYPEGVGADILSFLNNAQLFEALKSNLHKVRFLEPEGRDKEFMESYNKNVPEWSNEPDNRTEEQKRWFKTYIHRDLAAKILTSIANSEDEEIIIEDSEDSAKKGGWVKWSYVINLQDNTLSVYRKIDQPVLKVYDLNNLPTLAQFIKELIEEEEEA